MNSDYTGGLAGRTILITGISGFVGANLARALVAHGAVVHGLVRSATSLWRLADIMPRLALHTADLNEPAPLMEAVVSVRPEFVFHLASSHGHPMDAAARRTMLETAVVGTANLLDALRRVPFSRFVHVGSSLEYGPRSRPLRESDCPRPVTFRGVAKAAAMLLCQQFAWETGRPVVMLRPFSVYGPWEGVERLVPTAVLACLRGEAVNLTQPGVSHDMIHVADVVEACLMALGTPAAVGQVFNVGSGEQVTNEALVAAVQQTAGLPIRVHVGCFPHGPADTPHWVADIRKARRLLGWQPSRSLAGGLSETVAWFREHLDLYPPAGFP